jgi:acetyl-CoA C-acetyltransferase
VNGGAIAIGHPLGATGAMLLAVVLDGAGATAAAATELVTLCIGYGMGITLLVERAPG